MSNFLAKETLKMLLLIVNNKIFRANLKVLCNNLCTFNHLHSSL